MIIKFITDDITNTSLPYVAHGCNAQGVMRSGVAKAIREKWPNAYKKYKEVYDRRGNLKMGSVIIAPSDDKFVFNCITQEHYGRDGKRYVSYSALADCFKHINRIIPQQHIAIPMIGAGLGGGDWKLIMGIIDNNTPNVGVHLYQI